jgi:HSP20 family protein
MGASAAGNPLLPFEIWQPPVDIYRTPSGWLVKMDLAGVTPEDIQVRIEGSTLTVEGSRRDWLASAGLQHYSMEISYSRFSRSVTLPCVIQSARWEKEYRDGMLLVTLHCDESPSS